MLFHLFLIIYYIKHIKLLIEKADADALRVQFRYLLEYDYYDPALKEYRLREIEKVAEHSPVKHVFVKGSIADKALVDEVFASYQPAVVVNLATQAGVRYSIDHPDVYVESNLIGFYHILDACRHNPVEHLVYAFSSSVYTAEFLFRAFNDLRGNPAVFAGRFSHPGEPVGAGYGLPAG